MGTYFQIISTLVGHQIKLQLVVAGANCKFCYYNVGITLFLFILFIM